MKTYQFTCGIRVEAPGSDWDGFISVSPNLVTPPVTTETPTEAIHHPETKQYCDEHECVIYDFVGRR